MSKIGISRFKVHGIFEKWEKKTRWVARCEEQVRRSQKKSEEVEGAGKSVKKVVVRERKKDRQREGES